jgi:hypothetical protein
MSVDSLRSEELEAMNRDDHLDEMEIRSYRCLLIGGLEPFFIIYWE